MNSTEIKRQYVINNKVFDNLQDAEKYQNRLKVKSLNDYPTSSFDEIVYYKIFTNPRSQGCPRFQSGEELANSVGKINAYYSL